VNEIVIAGIVVVAIAVAIAGFTAQRRPRDVVAVEPPRVEDDGIVGEPTPIVSFASVDASPATEQPPSMEQPQTAKPPVTWARQFEPRSGPLDEAARLKLIGDLEMLRAAWCVPLLRQAAAEETSPEMRDAAERALSRCQNSPTSKRT